MIRGYLSGPQRRPFVQAVFAFPSLGNRQLAVRLLIDTGADRTVLAPADALRLGVDMSTLSDGAPTRGIGGQTATRSVDAMLTLDTYSTTLALTVLVSSGEPPAIPSLLGRDVLAKLALFLDLHTPQVLLLEPAEVAQFPLP